MAAQPRWKRGDFFLLAKAAYLAETKKIRVWFENHEIGEVSAQVLWGGRPGEADWPAVSVVEATHAALLVPTVAGHPTIEGETAEISP